LVGRLRVSLHFAQAGMARDSGNFVHSASCFSEAARSGLAQSMGRAMAKASFIATITEPITKPGGTEWLARLRGQ
jgi:hypothetical protein